MTVASAVAFGHVYPGGALEEAADRDGVGGVIRALVDDFQPILGTRQAAVT